MVEVSFDPEEADYLALLRAMLASGLKQPRFYRRVLIGAVAAAVFLTLVLMAAGEHWTDALGIAAGGSVGGIASVGIMVGLHWVRMPSRAHRLFGQQRTLHHHLSQRWTPDGLWQRTARGEGLHPWREFMGGSARTKSFWCC